MELIIRQDSFAEALRTAGRAVSSRNTVPVLSGIQLEALGQVLRIRATDLEVDISCQAPAEVRTEGAIVLPARYLQELVRRLPPGPVSLRVAPENATARLAWDESESVVHGFPADQFPAAGTWDGEQSAVTIEGAALAALLRETGFATAHDESRPWFTGVYMTVRGDGAVAMATDSAVIAYSEARIHNPGDLAFSVILPGRALQELGRLLPTAGVCRILPGHNRFRFELGEVALTTHLLEGQYPDFRKYLPASFPSQVAVDRERFLAACERAGLAADQNGIRLEAGPEGLKVTSRTPEVGAVTERLPAALAGDPFAIPLNVHFVLNGLRSMTGPDLLVEYAGPRTAVRFRANRAARSYFAVMPLLSF